MISAVPNEVAVCLCKCHLRQLTALMLPHCPAVPHSWLGQVLLGPSLVVQMLDSMAAQCGAVLADSELVQVRCYSPRSPVSTVMGSCVCALPPKPHSHSCVNNVVRGACELTWPGCVARCHTEDEGLWG